MPRVGVLAEGFGDLLRRFRIKAAAVTQWLVTERLVTLAGLVRRRQDAPAETGILVVEGQRPRGELRHGLLDVHH